MLEEKIEVLKWMKIVEEEINVKSDRSLIIISAAILDTQLANLLDKFLIDKPKKQEKIFNNNAPLATFSAKISLCYYLGIISEYEYRTLEIIRKIRNIFAHKIEIKKISDDQSLIDLCSSLEIPEGYNLLLDQATKVTITKEIYTTKYIKSFKNLTMYLDYRINEISQRTEYKNLSRIQLLKDGENRIIENRNIMLENNKKIHELAAKNRGLLIQKKSLLNKHKEKIENSNDKIVTKITEQEKEITEQIHELDKIIENCKNYKVPEPPILKDFGGTERFLELTDEVILDLEKNNN